MEPTTHKDIKKLLNDLNTIKPSDLARRSVSLRAPLLTSSPTIQNTRSKLSKADLWGRGGPM